MPIKLLAQLMLATSLLQFFPYDAGVVETYATLPEAEVREAPGVDTALSLMYRPLPMAENADLTPVKTNPYSLGVKTAAVSALVMDARTGAVLYEKASDQSRSIGSITKLMTALVFLSDDPDLNAVARITPDDVVVGGREHIPVSEDVTVRDLLHASLVSSDNSATMALVRLSGMPVGDFVGRMNERAAEIGMPHTTFADPVGLSPDNRSVTLDIVALLREALADEVIRNATEVASMSVTGASGRTYQLENTNELLDGFLNQSPYKIIGGKTGYLPEAGYCLGIQVQKDGGQDIFVVVLGSDSLLGRLQDVKALAVWAYQTFEWPGIQES